MNNENNEIQDLIDSGELPTKVSSRMLYAKLLDISMKLDDVIEKNQADHKCYQETTKNQNDYPSLTWLFAHKPIRTIGTMLLIFTLLMTLYTAGVLKVFGLAVGVNLP